LLTENVLQLILLYMGSKTSYQHMEFYVLQYYQVPIMTSTLHLMIVQLGLAFRRMKMVCMAVLVVSSSGSQISGMIFSAILLLV